MKKCMYCDSILYTEESHCCNCGGTLITLKTKPQEATVYINKRKKHETIKNVLHLVIFYVIFCLVVKMILCLFM